MNTRASEDEIIAVFQQLGIASDEERQRALFTINYSDPAKVPENLRFDIGFNASLPND
jgi:DNA gyrase inhibitor GyrI